MKYSKIMSIITTAAFSAVILYLSVSNYDVICQSIQNAFTDKNSAAEIQSGLSNVESELKGNFTQKSYATDIYGLGLSAMNKSTVGNYEFYKSEEGNVFLFSSKTDTSRFRSSMLELSNVASGKGIPLVYAQLPYLNLTQAEIDYSGYNYYIESAEEIMDSLPDSVDVLDFNRIYTEDIKRDFYFRTDTHPTTTSEIRTAKEICSFLSEKYGIEFPSHEQVFDMNNYTCSTYPFLGNSIRNCGRYYTEIDQFDILHPTFETSMDLYVYDNNFSKSGTFSEVCLNGYEDREDITEYTYWIRNYMQFPNSHYEINNYLSDGPRLMYITDSNFMTNMAYTSLAASHITIIDPRTLTDIYLINDLLNKEDYDAIIVGGMSPAFISSSFRSDVSLPETIAPFQQQSHGGMFLCVNKEMPATQRVIPYSMFGSGDTVTLNGWAADFLAGQPLSAMYLKAGDKLLKCSYGSPAPGIAKTFNNENLTNTLFSITVPKEIFEDLDYFEFILVGYGGSYRFTNVRYCISTGEQEQTADELTLPEEIKPAQTVGYNGMSVDVINYSKATDQGIISRSDLAGSDNLTLIGWAIDSFSNAPLSEIYLKVGERLIKCDYGLQMINAAYLLNDQNMMFSGFCVSVPVDYLDSVDKLEFIMIGSDGSYRFDAVEYQLVD